MTTTQILAVFGSLLFVLGGLATFVIAYRRGPSSWEQQLDRDARKADRGELPVVFGRAEASVDTSVSEGTVEPEPEAQAAQETAVVVAHAPAEPVGAVELPADEQGVNRRQFFNRALSATFFGTLGSFGLTSLAFMWPKVSGGFGSDVSAGPIQDIKDAITQPDGTITPFYMPSAKAWIVPVDADAFEDSQFTENQTVAEGLAALWQKCVHLGCAVPWCQSSQGFECPCHGSKYNSIGEYEAGPAPRNLDRFEVEVDKGELIIRTGDIIGSERAQTKSVKYPQGVFCTAESQAEV